MYLVECWIEHPVLVINHTFSYYSDFFIEPKVRVRVNFSNKNIVGFVDSCRKIDHLKDEEDKLGYKLKKIIEVIDEKAILTDELFILGKWLADQTVSPTISCFQTMLPKKIKPISNKERIVKVKKVKALKYEGQLSPLQKEVYDYVKKNEGILASILRKKYKTVANTLINKKALIIYEEAKSNSVNLKEYEKINDLPLTFYQNEAQNKILQSNKRVILLHGVTGSGKTEIYLQLARKIVAEGKQILFLVPEISLTPQMVKRVKERFSEKVAIYHSRLNNQEKYEQYVKVLHDEVKVVVGTRSAIFMPFNNLGLIIMDEEHDLSYKQDKTPQYHCRDIAIKRAENFNCKVLLGSATPSLESYARALKNVYELVELKTRINNMLPDIKIITGNNKNILSEILKNKIGERLANKQQVILLLNRRGFSTQIKCDRCNKIIMCPHCDLTMNYHHDVKLLKCHTCNTEMFYPKICDNCHSANSYKMFGFGTQKLENEILQTFTGVKVIRMDADTTTKKDSHEKLLEKFSNKEADILLGTQMIAKGLDYPNVTLVGIINGDAGLNRSDYRSQEVIYDMLTQASGRSGRSNIAGEVIIQVFNDENYIIDAVLKQDYKNFFLREMQYRKAGGYPPYNYLIAIIFSDRKQKKVLKQVYDFYDQLSGDFKILGPSELLKINDHYRYRIILKGKNLDEMRTDIKELLLNFKLSCHIKIDVNPLVLD